MLLKKFRNVVFASIIITSLASCSSQDANDNSKQTSSENHQEIEETQTDNSTESQDKDNVGGVNLAEDGTYIASFDTGKEGDEKYQNFDLEIQNNTLTIKGPLQFIASGGSDDEIKTLDDQANAFAIDQNTQFQVQDTYNQENHSQEEFLKTFEETKGKQIAIFVEVVNGKAVVINLGIKS